MIIKNKLTWFILFLVVVGFLISFCAPRKVYDWDEAVYLSNAENLFSDKPYYFEYHRPPLLPLLMNIGSLVFNIDFFTKSLIAFFFSLSIFMIYLVGKELYGEKIAFLTAFLWVINPFNIHSANEISINLPAISLFLSGFWFFLKFIKNKKGKSLYLSGIFSGLSALMWYPFIALLIIYPLYFLFRKIRSWDLIRVGTGTVLVFVPYFSAIFLRYGNPLAAMQKSFFIASNEPGSHLDLIYYFIASFVVLGPAVLAGLLFYIIHLKKETFSAFKTDYPLITWFLMFLIFITLIKHKEIRYITPAMPPLFILASKGYYKLKKNMKLWTVLFLIIIFSSFIFLNTKLFFGLLPLNQNNKFSYEEPIVMPLRIDTMAAAKFISTNMPKNYTVYSNQFYPLLAYYSKRKTVAVWPHDERFYNVFLELLTTDGWFVHYEGVNKHPTKEWLDNSSFFKKIKQFGDITLYEFHVPTEPRTQVEKTHE